MDKQVAKQREELEKQLKEATNPSNDSEESAAKWTLTDDDIKAKMLMEQQVIGNTDAFLSNLLSEKLSSNKGGNDPASFINNFALPSTSIKDILGNQLNSLTSNLGGASPLTDINSQIQQKLNGVTASPSQLIPKTTAPAQLNFPDINSKLNAQLNTSNQNEQHNISNRNEQLGSKKEEKTLESSSSVVESKNENVPMDTSHLNIPGPSPQSLLAMANPIEINKEKAKTAPKDLTMTIDQFQKQIGSGMIGPGFMRNRQSSDNFQQTPFIPSFNNSNNGMGNFGGFSMPSFPGESISKKKQASSNPFDFGDSLFSGVLSRGSEMLNPNEHMALPSGIPVLGNADSFKKFFGNKN